MGDENCEDQASDVSLPPSVKESDDMSDSVSLPPDVAEDADDDAEATGSGACCKKGKCETKFRPGDMEAYQLELQGCSQQLRLKRVFDEVRAVFRSGGSDPSKVMSWAVKGQPVCRRFFEKVHGVGHGQLDKMVALARNGQVELPAPGPRLQRQSPALANVDTWFVGLYIHLAEPLAVPGSGEHVPATGETPTDQHVTVASDHPLAALSLNLRQKKGDADPHGNVYVPQRFLNFGSEAQLWQFYQEDEAFEHQVSRSTFKKAWAKWQKFLPFKNSGEGSKCNICAQLTMERSTAVEPAEKLRVDAAKQTHLQTVMADRAYSVRCNKVAGRSDIWLAAKNHGMFCKLELDGMDQSKFAVPRLKQMAATSNYSKCWRPSVHVTGAVLFGQIEYYAVMGPDLAKNANINATITSRILDLMQKQLDDLGPEYGFPSELVVMCDNTPREAKNSHYGCYLASLVARGLFTATECHFLQVDHTHNELDQRFSTMASHIKQAQCIEDMSDLVAYLQSHMTAAANRTLIIEELKGTMDFKSFLSGVNLHLTGLTSTHLAPHANHHWRFASRLSIDESFFGSIECHHPDWQSFQEDPADVVLTVKQYLSSPKHSQPPQVVMPVQVAAQVPKDLCPAPRNKFADTTLVEFRKSAKIFAGPPWNLLKAQTFLEDLCDENEKGNLPPGITLQHYFSTSATVSLSAAAATAQDDRLPSETEDPEVPVSAAPRRVVAGRSKAKAKAKPKVKAAVKVAAAKCLKRPAAAPSQSEPPRAMRRPAASDSFEPNHGEASAAASAPAASPIEELPAESGRVAAETVDAELPKRFHYGCSKCRKKSKFGCAECIKKAEEKHKGWKRLSNGHIVRDLDVAGVPS